MRALIIDTETTGTEEADHVVELAWWSAEFDQVDEGDATRVEFDKMPEPFSSLVKPPIPIPVTAMAVHHITNAMVEGQPALETLAERFDMSRVTHYVAHNAPFERARLDRVLPSRPWVCTYRCAMHVWPDAPSHRNAALRYWFGMPHPGDSRAEPHHRALPDAYVTMHLFHRLLTMRSVERLVELSTTPVVLKKVGFGKHFGQEWADVPHDYLQWCAKQSDMDPDVIHTVKHWLAQHYKRSGGRPG